MLFIVFRVSITWYTWMPAWGWGKSRSSPPPPPHCFAILGVFCHFSLCGARSATFYSMVGAFFGLAPPLRKFLGAPMLINWYLIIVCGYSPGLGSSTVDQVLKYTKYPKYIPSTNTGQVLIFLKKYLSTSSTFISSTSTSTSTHIKICSKVRMDIQSRVNFG